MFAGIVESTGVVTALREGGSQHAGGGVRLTIDLGELRAGLALGASVAVNGVCLTLAELRGTVGGFDVIPETLAQTNLGRLQPGRRVNLERSLRVGDRIDGHFVQGHVDGVATVEEIRRDGGEWRVCLRVDADLTPYIIYKGSIAIDGVSLTTAEADSSRFAVALIPTTLGRTTLGERKVGDVVNIETDILTRTIVQRLDAIEHARRVRDRGVSYETLRDSGFAP